MLYKMRKIQYIHNIYYKIKQNLLINVIIGLFKI